jgi:hypothetical protein
MGVGVDGLGLGRGAEELGGLGKALLVRLLGKGKLFAVGLGFAGKGFFQVLLGLGHGCLLI